MFKAARLTSDAADAQNQRQDGIHLQSVLQGPVRAMAVDGQGQQMVTAGADGQVKVWDARKLQAMHAYFSHAPVECLDISQRGLLAVGYGRSIQVWRDAPDMLLERCLQATGCVQLIQHACSACCPCYLPRVRRSRPLAPVKLGLVKPFHGWVHCSLSL